MAELCVETETLWPVKAKIVIIWSFTEKTADPWYISPHSSYLITEFFGSNLPHHLVH